MKNCKTLLGTLSVLALASCGGAHISGTLTGASEAEVVVRLLDVNKYTVIDTLKTSKSGSYSCKVDVKKGQPEFIYIFHGDTKIASLLLQSGDRVKVVSDTLGNYTVTGSDETEKLMAVERDEAEFLNAFAATSAKLDDLEPSSGAAAEVRKDLTKQYIAYYRSRVQYVMENSHSLTAIPVLYQNVNQNLPLFSQATDALHFRSVCDSLKQIYPQSRYVKALEEQTKEKENYLELKNRLETAQSSSFPELELPDINGQKVKLSSLDAQLVMIYFWAAGAAEQKMLNLDVIKPLYEKYHDLGFEIYAVSLDADKTAWAGVVKNQKLPWVNVCDGLGTLSPAVGLYNVASVPTVYFIDNGTLAADNGIRTEAALKNFIENRFKKR